MPKRFEICTDSPADLNPELASRFSVTTVPLTIHIDGREYKDGVDITPAEMFRLCDAQKTVPKTSAVPVGDYIDVFSKRSADGAEVLHISLGSKISATHQNAVLAAQEVPGVYVVDSDNLSCSISLLVYERRSWGTPRPRQRPTKIRPHRHGFVIDTLDISAAAAAVQRSRRSGRTCGHQALHRDERRRFCGWRKVQGKMRGCSRSLSAIVQAKRKIDPAHRRANRRRRSGFSGAPADGE